MATRTWIIRLSIAGGAVLVLMILHQYVIAGLLLIAGTSPHCSYRQAVASISLVQRQEKMRKETAAASRRLQSDPELGLELWETPLARFWLPGASANEVFYGIAEQMRDIYNYQNLGVKSGDIVLDGGANVGVYTQVALNAGARKVVAIEPAPENLECLRRNFEKEIAEGRVVIYPKGVWDKDDWLTLYVYATNSAQDSFVRQMPGATQTRQKFPLTTIDKLVEELKLERVDYIKLDIEGAERKALAGAWNTMARFHPRLAICVYHISDDPTEIPKPVQSAWSGYRQVCGECLVGSGRVYPEVFFYF